MRESFRYLEGLAFASPLYLSPDTHPHPSGWIHALGKDYRKIRGTENKQICCRVSKENHYKSDVRKREQLISTLLDVLESEHHLRALVTTIDRCEYE